MKIFKKRATAVLLTTFFAFSTQVNSADNFFEYTADLQPQEILPNCYVPRSARAESVIRELRELTDISHKAVSLKGCSFLFSDDSKGILFDIDTARRFSDSLPAWVEILDLSENRFPSDLLISMSSLLERDTFKFLDVRLNAGADSLNAIQAFTRYNQGSFNKLSIVRKIIWLQEYSLDSIGVLPPTYKEAHREYFSLYRQSPPCVQEQQWSFPLV
jgi:hypothetical protein